MGIYTNDLGLQLNYISFLFITFMKIPHKQGSTISSIDHLRSLVQ